MNRDEKKRKKRRRPGGREPRRTAILVLAVLVALAALGGGGYLLLSEYALLGGRIVARDAVALALPDGALPEAAAFGALRSLQTIDLRGREDVTRDYVAAVQAAAPAGCEVLWTVRLSDGAFSSDAETLTLPGCTAADASMLDCFPRLKRVDATGSTAYAALCEAAQARDDVAFTYALVVGDAVLTNADTTLTATGVDDVTTLLQALPFFPALREADLRDGSAPAAEMRALCEAFPEIHFRYTVWMGGRAFDSDAETLDLSGVTFDDAQAAIDALSCFPNLEAADLFDSGLSATDGQAVAAALPTLAVRYAVPLCGATFASDATELDLRELQVDAAALDAGLGYFSGLTAVLLPDGALDDAALDALEAAYPDVLFQRQIEVLGHVVSTIDTELDVSGTRIEDVEQVEAALSQLPRLQKLVMCGCGLTDEQMAALGAAPPGVRFLWTVKIGPHEVRTDATGFSTANPSKYTNPNASDEYNEKVRTTKRLREGDLEPLRYCTDLVALDLGHNYLTDADLAVIASLTKLQILILADNKITDISALSALEELQYIELFMNKIEDVSPLASLTKLLDVNICNIGLTDLSPLYGMTWLERLWYGMNPASTEDKQALAAALPDCECNYTTRDETGDGWREHERYTWMRSFFK